MTETLELSRTLQEVARCAAAGFVATAPMTAYMEWADQARVEEPGSSLPPRTLVAEAFETVGAPRMEALVQPATWAAHYGYGATVGALGGLTPPPVSLAAAVIGGAVSGLEVWGLSYFGLLPALGSSARGTRQPHRNNRVLFAAHVIWGATFGVARYVLQPRHARSRTLQS